MLNYLSYCGIHFRRFDAAKQIDNHEVLRHFDSIGHSLRSPFYTVAEYVPATSDIVKPRGPISSFFFY